jgi:hypothetical protein
MHGTPREVWAQIMNRFDPDGWTTRDEWLADRPDSPAGKVIKALDLPRRCPPAPRRRASICSPRRNP